MTHHNSYTLIHVNGGLTFSSVNPSKHCLGLSFMHFETLTQLALELPCLFASKLTRNMIKIKAPKLTNFDLFLMIQRVGQFQ